MAKKRKRKSKVTYKVVCGKKTLSRHRKKSVAKKARARAAKHSEATCTVKKC